MYTREKHEGGAIGATHRVECLPRHVQLRELVRDVLGRESLRPRNGGGRTSEKRAGTLAHSRMSARVADGE